MFRTLVNSSYLQQMTNAASLGMIDRRSVDLARLIMHRMDVCVDKSVFNTATSCRTWISHEFDQTLDSTHRVAYMIVGECHEWGQVFLQMHCEQKIQK
jgi:hypothetical protein